MLDWVDVEYERTVAPLAYAVEKSCRNGSVHSPTSYDLFLRCPAAVLTPISEPSSPVLTCPPFARLHIVSFQYHGGLSLRIVLKIYVGAIPARAGHEK